MLALPMYDFYDCQLLYPRRLGQGVLQRILIVRFNVGFVCAYPW